MVQSRKEWAGPVGLLATPSVFYAGLENGSTYKTVTIFVYKSIPSGVVIIDAT